MGGQTGRRTRRRAATRAAVTIMELLVVISIVGMLLALMLPAIQQSREAGRRVVCQNNLRQTGIAMLTHESALRRYPSNGWGFQWYGDPDRGSAQEQPGGWVYNLLRYLERRDLAEYGQGEPDAQRRATIAKMNQSPLAIFNCPTRRGAGLYPSDAAWPPRNAATIGEVAKTDYAVNAGDFWIAAGGPSGYAEAADPTYVWTDFSKATGVSFFRSTIGQDDVLDGKSYTYLVGEKCVNNFGLDPGDDQGLFVGYDLDNSRWTMLGLLPVLDGSANSSKQFGSAHPSVCQFVFCDGSVRGISYGIDAETHRRLGNRKDRELIDDSLLK